MRPYTVVWSGEIEKRVHDQQIKPAPPIDDKRPYKGFRQRARPTKSTGRLRDANFWRLCAALFGKRTRKKIH
jgi:hypothetical protein